MYVCVWRERCIESASSVYILFSLLRWAIGFLAFILAVAALLSPRATLLCFSHCGNCYKHMLTFIFKMSCQAYRGTQMMLTAFTLSWQTVKAAFIDSVATETSRMSWQAVFTFASLMETAIFTFYTHTRLFLERVLETLFVKISCENILSHMTNKLFPCGSHGFLRCFSAADLLLVLS